MCLSRGVAGYRAPQPKICSQNVRKACPPEKTLSPTSKIFCRILYDQSSAATCMTSKQSSSRVGEADRMRVHDHPRNCARALDYPIRDVTTESQKHVGLHFHGSCQSLIRGFVFRGLLVEEHEPRVRPVDFVSGLSSFRAASSLVDLRYNKRYFLERVGWVFASARGTR